MALERETVQFSLRDRYKTLDGRLVLDRDIVTTLSGGYDCPHVVRTTLQGTMTIGKGKVIIEGMVIR